MRKKKIWKRKNSIVAVVLMLAMVFGMISPVSARPMNEGTAMDGEHPQRIFIRWDSSQEGQVEDVEEVFQERVQDKEVARELSRILKPHGYHQYPLWLVEAYLNNPDKEEKPSIEEEYWMDEVLEVELEENISEGMFQFLKLSKPLGLSSRELNFLLMDTPLEGLGRAFMESGRAREINELYLITEAMMEAKKHNPKKVEGILVEEVAGSPVEGRLVYNIFGIGASENNPVKSAYEFAYEEEWFTPEESIKGGAQWLADHKIHRGEEAQDTLFKELWNALDEPENLETRLLELEKKQQWQRGKISDFYESLHLFTYYFEIPEGALEEIPGEEKISEWPVPEQTRVSSGFGLRRDPFEDDLRFHYGMDIPGPLEGPVVAARAGVVRISRKGGSYGNWIKIDHGEGWTTRYAHNHENLVVVGEEVEKGQVIARLGTTGRSTGPHLHFEVRKNGKPIDPMYWFESQD